MIGKQQWIVAVRERGDWKQIGTTMREPTAELVPDLLNSGHVPNFREELFREEGTEVRFIPVGGGAAVAFMARYEMVVEATTIEEAEAARLPSLDRTDDDFDDDDLAR